MNWASGLPLDLWALLNDRKPDQYINLRLLIANALLKVPR